MSVRSLFAGVLSPFVGVAIMTIAWVVPASAADIDSPLELAADERVLTIVGTNDIHGGWETAPVRNGQGANSGKKMLGGFEWFAGYLAAVRAHVARDFDNKGAVLLLDAGDAAQGTLLSNFSEGMLAGRLMNQVGYTAAVPGNHAYDFGPEGWLVDSASQGGQPQDRRAALEKMLRASQFPFLGANVTMKKGGAPYKLLPPYTLVEVFGRRHVCVIGLENPFTRSTTVAENVDDLEFTDGVKELRDTVEGLTKSGKADVFVLVMHEGDGTKPGMAHFLGQLPRRSDGQPLLDAVIAGHTHTINDNRVEAIPYIQSGANGQHFGVIQLVLKRARTSGKLSVVRNRTRQKAGIPIEPKEGTFMGQPVKADGAVKKILAEGRATVETLASRKLAELKGAMGREKGRTEDCPMGNLTADVMRQVAGTEVAAINFGDIRDGLPKGMLTYERLFQAIPKNIQLTVIPKLPTELLVKNLVKCVQSCGRRGVLQMSGLTMEFERNCVEGVDEDREARLLKVTTTGGRVLYQRKGSKEVFDPQPVSMATTDFVVGGGAGFNAWTGLPVDGKTWPLREAMADQLEAQKVVDPASHAKGRYINKAK